MQKSNARSRDELYKLYGNEIFNVLIVDEAIDPELAKFVNETKTQGPKFSNYATEKLEHFVNRIYELRKNNPNNPA